MVFIESVIELSKTEINNIPTFLREYCNYLLTN